MSGGGGLGFRVTGDATVRRAVPMICGHVVCRGPDGRVKWEADTVPVPLAFNPHGADGLDVQRLTIDGATLVPGDSEGGSEAT